MALCFHQWIVGGILHRPAVAILCGLLIQASLSADILILNDGGRIEGSIIFKEKEAYYLVELPGKTLIGVPKGDVKQYVRETPELVEYRKRSESLTDSAESHWEFSKWCRQNGLIDQANRHVSRVIELEPNHGPARASLKETLVNGAWVPKDQLQRMRGKILIDGKWQIPEAHAINSQDSGARSKIQAWQGKLPKMRSEARKKGYQAILAINDPTASVAIKEWVRDLLEEKQPSQGDLLVCLELLTQWDTAATINALCWMALCNDHVVRERAISLLKQKDPAQAASYFITELRSSENLRVRRAALALAQMGVGDPTLALIDALKTKHKFLETVGGGGGNVDSSFTPDGSGGGMSYGNKTKQVIRELRNDEVLSALISLNQGINFQFDQAAWRLWYAKRADYPYDLRRDP